MSPVQGRAVRQSGTVLPSDAQGKRAGGEARAELWREAVQKLDEDPRSAYTQSNLPCYMYSYGYGVGTVACVGGETEVGGDQLH